MAKPLACMLMKLNDSNQASGITFMGSLVIQNLSSNQVAVGDQAQGPLELNQTSLCVDENNSFISWKRKSTLGRELGLASEMKAYLIKHMLAVSEILRGGAWKETGA